MFMACWLCCPFSSFYLAPSTNKNLCCTQTSNLFFICRPLLQALQEELRGRQRQVSSLQEISSQLLLETTREDSVEAKEKVHVICNKLRLLLRQVAAELRALQGRLVGPSDYTRAWKLKNNKLNELSIWLITVVILKLIPKQLSISYFPIFLKKNLHLIFFKIRPSSSNATFTDPEISLERNTLFYGSVVFSE